MHEVINCAKYLHTLYINITLRGRLHLKYHGWYRKNPVKSLVNFEYWPGAVFKYQTFAYNKYTIYIYKYLTFMP